MHSGGAYEDKYDACYTLCKSPVNKKESAGPSAEEHEEGIHSPGEEPNRGHSVVLPRVCFQIKKYVYLSKVSTRV